MSLLKTVYVILFVVLCYFQAQGADKYTDENRPYEFGFTIDGEQHRHEKKDENGIIMGEFGFITADGVYHVTVYATDENGNFKILSMKNIRVKPYPTSIDVRGRQGHSIPIPPSQQLLTPHTASKAQPAKQESNSNTKSCSHCKVPTTTTTLSPQLTNLPIISTNNIRQTQTGYSQNKAYQQINTQHKTSQQSLQLSTGQNYHQASISSQSEQHNPTLAPSYPNQILDYKNQDLPQNLPRQQASLQESTQEGFNVGRMYLQKLRNQQIQQQPSAESHSVQQTNPALNSPQQSNAELNYQEKLTVGYAQQQGNIAGKLNVQSPHISQNDQIIPNSRSQSYLEQSGVKVQNFGAFKIQQNSPTSKTEQTALHKSNTDDNNYVQQDVYQNQSKNPNNLRYNSAQETTAKDRQPKTFKDIIQTVSPEQQYKSTSNTANLYSSSQQNVEKPVLIAAQMQLVDKNTNIHHKNPGENEGLPKGLTKVDMTQLLYTFNYTVGFHGHHEEGYRNGAKIGYYYVTGRNGVRTRVDYVADEKGFHPRISQEVLDIQSDEVPKPETEKEEKFGLKGYEFKWLFYPVDSK